MARAAPRLCTYPGCNLLVPAGQRRCAPHLAREQSARDQVRGSASTRGYGGRWRVARTMYLRRHPLCRRCEAEGVLTAATVVDHVTPHRGDQALFWDSNNWQPLCKPHHDQKTAVEDGGFGRPSRA